MGNRLLSISTGELFADSIAGTILRLVASSKAYLADGIVRAIMCKVREPARFGLKHKET